MTTKQGPCSHRFTSTTLWLTDSREHFAKRSKNLSSLNRRRRVERGFWVMCEAHWVPVWPVVRIKCCPKFPKVAQKATQQFFLKNDVFKVAQNDTQYLGYFCRKFWHQEVSEMAQSGHTGHTSENDFLNMGHPLYSLFSVFSSKLYNTNMWKNVHLVPGAGIWTHNKLLWVLLLQQPDQGSRPVRTI